MIDIAVGKLSNTAVSVRPTVQRSTTPPTEPWMAERHQCSLLGTDYILTVHPACSCRGRHV